MSWVAVGVGAVGLTEATIGEINKSKANKKAEALAKNRPKLTSSPFNQDALSLSESELSNGMSAGAKTAYEEGADRDFSAAVGGIVRMGGSANNVGSVFANSETGRQRLAIMKDNLRLSQIDRLYRAQQGSEEDREKDFQFNDWAPWADASQANAVAKGNAQSEIFSGINTATSAGMRGAETGNSNAQFAAMLKKLTTTGGGSGVNANANAQPEPAQSTYLDSILNDDGEGANEHG